MAAKTKSVYAYYRKETTPRAWIGLVLDALLVTAVWLRLLPWWVVAVFFTLNAVIVAMDRFTRALR